MKPEGKNWLFAIVIFGDMIQTFVLELIAILSPPECVVSPLACAVSPTSANGTCVAAPANGTCTCVAIATVVLFSVISLSAIVPGITYLCIMDVKECQPCNDVEDKCQHYIDVILSRVYTLFGPILYYYGDNVSKVVDLGDTLGCSADCQRVLRISGVAALFLFLLMNILIGRISKSKESKLNSKWWAPVADMIVELLPLYILYTAFLRIARSNMIFTSTTFCSAVDGVFWWVVFAIIFIYTALSIRYSFKKFNKKENSSKGYKHFVCGSGILVFFGFLVYLVVDNSLPLDFFLCLCSNNIALIVHIVRCALAIICVTAVFLFCVVGQCKCSNKIYSAQFKVLKKLKEKLKEILKVKLKNIFKAKILKTKNEEEKKKLKAILKKKLKKKLKDELKDELKDKLKNKLKDCLESNKSRIILVVTPEAHSIAAELVVNVVDKSKHSVMGELVDKLVGESVNELVDESVDEVVDESVDEVVDESVDESVDEVVDRSVNKSEDELVDELVNKLVDELVDELVNKLVDESTIKSRNCC